MCLAARQLDAEEADRYGLVSRVVDDADLKTETLRLAARVASFSAPALMALKECVNRAYKSSLAEGILFERRELHARFSSAVRVILAVPSPCQGPRAPETPQAGRRRPIAAIERKSFVLAPPRADKNETPASIRTNYGRNIGRSRHGSPRMRQSFSIGSTYGDGSARSTRIRPSGRSRQRRNHRSIIAPVWARSK